MCVNIYVFAVCGDQTPTVPSQQENSHKCVEDKRQCDEKEKQKEQEGSVRFTFETKNLPQF